MFVISFTCFIILWRKFFKIQLLENKNYIKWLSEIKHDHSEKEIKRRQLFIKEELRQGGKVKDVQILEMLIQDHLHLLEHYIGKRLLKKLNHHLLLGMVQRGIDF